MHKIFFFLIALAFLASVPNPASAKVGDTVCGTLIKSEELPGLTAKMTIKNYETKKRQNFYYADDSNCWEFVNLKTMICFEIIDENNDHMGMEPLGVRDTPMRWIDQCVVPD